MNFDIHSDAVAAFNAKASELVDAVRVRPSSPKSQPVGYKPDVHVGFHFTAEHLRGPLEVFQSDQHGRRISRFIDDHGTVLGLDESAYPRLVKVGESIQKTPAFRNAVSLRFIEDALFGWCLETLKGSETVSATDYVIRKSEQAVRHIEIWVPIYALHIQSEFSVGVVRFKTITREMVDVWQQGLSEKAGKNASIAYALDRQRKEIQGFAAAVTGVEAEPIRATEIASDLADSAASLLRFFSPASFDPHELSFCVPLGSHERQGHHYLTVEAGKITTETRGVKQRGTNPWVIDERLLRELEWLGLAAISALFAKQPKTPLEQVVFDALLLYSKAALAPDAAEKLLYIFAALESALLRNNSEPITQNIGERLAFLAGGDAESRLRIAKAVAEAYAIRSAFVHHGKRQDEYDLTEFMMAAWNGLHALVGNTANFKTKEELLDTIERHKYR